MPCTPFLGNHTFGGGAAEVVEDPETNGRARLTHYGVPAEKRGKSGGSVTVPQVSAYARGSLAPQPGRKSRKRHSGKRGASPGIPPGKARPKRSCGASLPFWASSTMRERSTRSGCAQHALRWWLQCEKLSPRSGEFRISPPCRSSIERDQPCAEKATGRTRAGFGRGDACVALARK